MQVVSLSFHLFTHPKSSVLRQEHWSAVLALAADTAPAALAGTEAARGAAAGVRRAALNLMDVMVRGGYVLPWSAIPTLVALCTDPTECGPSCLLPF